MGRQVSFEMGWLFKKFVGLMWQRSDGASGSPLDGAFRVRVLAKRWLMHWLIKLLSPSVQ